ncbi:GDSL-type esterase/lipase family protein [Sphingomonas sp.]|uniref:SGNH/GDSL hydrolase family protein n=1 Tax=Sphingomonas sp. TaxID=28214 RepID=UPI0035AFAA7C
MRTMMLAVGLVFVAASAPAQAPSLTITRTDDSAATLRALPMQVGGRTVQDGTELLRQWPGTYFESAFRGPAFAVGKGRVHLTARIDDGAPTSLVEPRPGLYRITGLTPGEHRLRIDVVSESQAEPTAFGGIFAPDGTTARPPRARARRIEFIGDSHTVGYGNTAASGTCTQDQVWSTTDTTRGLPGLLGARYDADYRVNAISGRGIVRNYNGFAADTLPQAYPYATLDHAHPANDRGWSPQVIVIALGTNDFSTALRPPEKWKTRDALHADYQQTYVRFVQTLRARHPRARIVLWSTDLADGEIATQVAQVHARLRASGDTRVSYVPVHNLAFSGCHAHPSTTDDAAIADAVAHAIDADPAVWKG